EDDFYQLFDAVPLKAGVVAVADNRFVFFDILEEYELGPRLIITDTGFVSYTQTSMSSSVWTYGSDNASAAASVFSGMSAGDAAILSDLNRINRQGFKGRGIYKLGV